MTVASNSAVVRLAIDEVCNRGLLDLADTLFTATYLNHGGLIPDLVHGPEAIKLGVALYRVAFPDFHLVVNDLVTDGDLVMLHWTAYSARSGRQANVEWAGPPGQMTGTTQFRLTSGQIAESWTRWDREAALVNLGVIPPPEAV